MCHPDLLLFKHFQMLGNCWGKRWLKWVKNHIREYYLTFFRNVLFPHGYKLDLCWLPYYLEISFWYLETFNLYLQFTVRSSQQFPVSALLFAWNSSSPSQVLILWRVYHMNKHILFIFVKLNKRAWPLAEEHPTLRWCSKCFPTVPQATTVWI